MRNLVEKLIFYCDFTGSIKSIISQVLMLQKSRTTYLYLHGFASSPQSLKAHYLQEKFAALGMDLKRPDLNQGDFTNLTLTRQLKQVESEFLSPLHLTQTEGESVTLIGSSFGGLTATWLAQRHVQIERLILLAPAFNFTGHWLPKLGEQQLTQWQREGTLLVYHYGEKQYLPLNYQFIVDVQQYADDQLLRPVPTLIIHGKNDEVIPIEASQSFAAKRPWVELIEVEDDHSLATVLPEIWHAIQKFCQFKV